MSKLLAAYPSARNLELIESLRRRQLDFRIFYPKRQVVVDADAELLASTQNQVPTGSRNKRLNGIDQEEDLTNPSGIHGDEGQDSGREIYAVSTRISDWDFSWSSTGTQTTTASDHLQQQQQKQHQWRRQRRRRVSRLKGGGHKFSLWVRGLNFQCEKICTPLKIDGGTKFTNRGSSSSIAACHTENRKRPIFGKFCISTLQKLKVRKGESEF